jgi:hypothetical protein
MLGKFTWKDLLKFLLEQREKGLLQEDHDVFIRNVETGDEYICDIVELDGRLVIGYNSGEETWDLK